MTFNHQSISIKAIVINAIPSLLIVIHYFFFSKVCLIQNCENQDIALQVVSEMTEALD